MTGLRRLIIAISFFFVTAGAGDHIAIGGSIYIEGSSGALATLDPTTGVVTEIGSTGRVLYGLGFDSAGDLCCSPSSRPHAKPPGAPSASTT
jgi:hypothetical protein